MKIPTLMLGLTLLSLACGGSTSQVCPGPAVSGPKQPEATDICSPAQNGKQICPGGKAGYGYLCTGSCWQMFFDGPCTP